MRKRSYRKCVVSIFILAFFSVLLSERLWQMSEYQKYRIMTLKNSWYRAYFFDENMEKISGNLTGECKALYRNVRDEAEFFPIPESTIDPSLTVSYVDSWQAERNYKGKSGHEGTDIMAGVDERGRYPVLSMTDGTVTNLGWLEKGGYRVGITSDSGTYYYYAHLDSYSDIKEGDRIKAGEFLGYMGDSGYGEEGTRGQFAVHLHVGIYIYINDEEISVNPYYVLQSLENKKLKYAYS